MPDWRRVLTEREASATGLRVADASRSVKTRPVVTQDSIGPTFLVVINDRDGCRWDGCAVRHFRYCPFALAGQN